MVQANSPAGKKSMNDAPLNEAAQVPLGFIGLGLMGSALTNNLMAAGFPVRGCDINPERVAQFAAAGGTPASTPAEVADGAAVVITSLMSSDIVRTVILGTNGALERMPFNSVLIDMSTVHPSASAALADELRPRGISMLDAPISGSSTQARQRDVVFLVGGDMATFSRCELIFRALGRSAHHMGKSGAGARTKLVVNMVLGLNRLVLAEGLMFGIHQGIDGMRLLDVLRDCPSYSRAMDMTGERMVKGRFEPESTLAQHRKDVELMLDLGHSAGVPLFLSNYHREIMIAGEAAGYAKSDTAALIAILHQFAGKRFEAADK
jgi:3-hydroxyisobutyrate dehydrogenase-like beta-hydroxyacid dehydrogenase